MFEKLLIEQAAPTLAGIKPASLFPYCADSLEHAFNEIAKWSGRLSGRRLSISRHKNNTGKLKTKQNDNFKRLSH